VTAFRFLQNFSGLGEAAKVVKVESENREKKSLLGVIRFSRIQAGWWRGTVVERRSLAGELSLSCARPAADG